MISSLLLPLAAALPQQFVYRLEGPTPQAQFGCSLGNLGDVDGDGQADFAVGARKSNVGGTLAGAIYVYSGVDGTLLWEAHGSLPGMQLGISICGLGDIDFDGIPDVAASSHRDNSSGFPSGSVSLFSGADGTLLRELTSPLNWDRFGFSIANTGDIDGDDIPDLLVGAPEDDWQGAGSGSVSLFSGADGGLLMKLFGTDPWDLFGSSVTGLGDVNFDSVPDFAVGAPRADQPLRDAGAVYVFSGADGSILNTHTTDTHTDAFGNSLSLLGDINRDGFADLAIGALNDFSNLVQKRGFVEIRSLGPDNATILRIEPKSPYERFSSSLAAAGDLEGDGYADFFAGAPDAGNAATNGLAAGDLRVYSGVSGREMTQFSGTHSSARLGSSVLSLGDLTGDSLPEYVIGEPGANPQGAVTVWSPEACPQIALHSFSAGSQASIDFSSAFPNTPVDFIYSLQGFGVTEFPSGLTLDIASPIVHFATTQSDQNGAAQVSFPVPSGSTGIRVWFQAWCFGGPSPGIGSIAITNLIH